MASSDVYLVITQLAIHVPVVEVTLISVNFSSIWFNRPTRGDLCFCETAHFQKSCTGNFIPVQDAGSRTSSYKQLSSFNLLVLKNTFFFSYCIRGIPIEICNYNFFESAYHIRENGISSRKQTNRNCSKTILLVEEDLMIYSMKGNIWENQVHWNYLVEKCEIG